MKKIFLYFLSFFFTFSLFSQSKTVLEIGERKISDDEFMYFFLKNNNSKDAYSYKELRDYMDMFVKFKMKVYEAETMKMDTSKNFINELNGYRTKLAQPYLTDKKNEEEAIREYYDRLSYVVDCSHILIQTPAGNNDDTLEAYNKIWDIYEEIKNVNDFEKFAVKYSQDKSVTNNKGNLGFSSVDQYVYPFENAMYNTEVGKISKPFRTSFGYHIVKVNSKVPSKGKYKVAHIMNVVPEGVSVNDRKKTRDMVFAVYDSIKNSKLSFEDAVVKYSEDKRTASKKGELGWVEISSRYIPVFKEAVFNLKNIGDIDLVETHYGFHIVKLLEIEAVKPYEEIRNEIAAKIQNTVRTQKSKTLVLERIKNETNYKKVQENLDAISPLFTDSIFKGTLVVENIDSYTKPIITFADKVYYQKDFINYVMKYNRRQNIVPMKSFIAERLRMFEEDVLTKYEISKLELKYPEFKNIISEYHDGMLLFQISDEKIWGKAVKDTVGLEKFYNENKNNYMWNYRYNIVNYECKDSKVAKSVQKLAKKKSSDEEITKKINLKDSTAVVVLKKHFGEKNSDINIEKYISKYNIPEEKSFSKIIVENNDNKINVITINVISPEIKKLSETKGTVIADYQKVLEEKWINDLNKKYNVAIHDDVLKSLVK